MGARGKVCHIDEGLPFSVKPYLRQKWEEEKTG